MLLTIGGCVTKEQDQGGYAQQPEYNHGEYQSYPAHMNDPYWERR
jgi:hypothetical protein